MVYINLPRHLWFLNDHEGKPVINVHTNSYGTDPDEGCLHVKTFNYKVYVDISSGDESQYKLIAECYVIQPWDLGSEKTDFNRSEFENSDEGIKAASDWLSKTAMSLGFR